MDEMEVYRKLFEKGFEVLENKIDSLSKEIKTISNYLQKDIEGHRQDLDVLFKKDTENRAAIADLKSQVNVLEDRDRSKKQSIGLTVAIIGMIMSLIFSVLSFFKP